MLWKKKLLADCKLYLILDTEVNDYDSLFEIAREAVISGVDILQLRDKSGLPADILKFSRRILPVIRSAAVRRKKQILFIMNDRVDLAIASGASGVHIGQDDLPLPWVRKMMGTKAVIGVSCQNLKQAQLAQRQGADYIGFGSIFKTKTKPQRNPMDFDLLHRVFKKIKIPVFAIGGIDQNNVILLKDRGVDRVAVCRAISQTQRISHTVRTFREILDRTWVRKQD